MRGANELEGQALRQSCEEQVGFEQRKMHAETNAWPGTKWDKGVTLNAGLMFGREAFRLEALRMWEEVGPSMQRIGADEWDWSPQRRNADLYIAFCAMP